MWLRQLTSVTSQRWSLIIHQLQSGSRRLITGLLTTFVAAVALNTPDGVGKSIMCSAGDEKFCTSHCCFEYSNRVQGGSKKARFCI